MIKRFEKLIPASTNNAYNTLEIAQNSDRKISSQKNSHTTAKLMASLVCLGVLGYAGSRILRRQNFCFALPVAETASFKNLFEQIKCLPSEIWINVNGKGHCVKNPQTVQILKKLENLPLKERGDFVKEYCEFTGFPNLEKIAENIDNEILKNISIMSHNGNNKALFAGYNSNSSIGRKMALPGSDCDGLFIVVEKHLSEKVNKGILGESINQRLVLTTGTHYPEVFSIDDIIAAIQKSEVAFRKIVNEEKIKLYESNILYKGNDHIKAAAFNIDIASQIENIHDKDMICEAAFFVELLRSGKVLLNNIDNRTLDFIRNSALYKYSNLFRQEGLKGQLKPKLINRQKLCNDFYNKSDEEKFEICRDLLASSFGEKSVKNASGFEDFDMGNIIEMYQKISSFFG